MAPHRNTTEHHDTNFRPPLDGDESITPPLLPERIAPQWEVPLTPGIDLGFSHAKGTIHLLPPDR